mgnify:CR=1 FL=1
MDYGYAWHVHHEKLVEPLTEPIENRIVFIKMEKPTDEVPLRLKLLRPVRSTNIAALFKAYQEAIATAWKAYQEAIAPTEKADQEAKATAWKAYREAKAPAEKAYQEAKATAEKAYREAKAPAWKEILALHAIECEADCPWNGETIFP